MGDDAALVEEPLVMVVGRWTAECMDCGWVSDEREEESQADQDAKEHRCG